MEYRVLLVGGGSGGHVYPLIAVAEALREKASYRGADLKLMIIGPGDFIERAAEENKIPFKKIYAGKFRRYWSRDTFLDLLKLPLGFLQSLWYLFWFMPDVVMAKGGYGSIGPGLIARLYNIPVFIHESDSIPGLANIFLSKIAEKIFISFQNTGKYFKNSKIILVGNPVRKGIFNADRDAALAYFDLGRDRRTVLVLGGSQGAKNINEVTLASMVLLTEKVQIIHQCGESQYEIVKNEVGNMAKERTGAYTERIEKYYRLYSFLSADQLAMAYAAADVIISRAGAATLFEIAQLGKPAIIIPILNSPANHQFLNAFEFARFGAFLLEEHNLTRDSLINQIEFCLRPEHYQKISEGIKGFAAPDAADKIAEELLNKK